MPGYATPVGELTLFNVDTQETVRKLDTYITHNGSQRLLSDSYLTDMVSYCQVGSGLVRHYRSSEGLFHPRGNTRSASVTVEDGFDAGVPVWIVRCRALFPQGSVASSVSEIAFSDGTEVVFAIASVVAGEQIKAIPVSSEDRLECQLVLKIPKPDLPRTFLQQTYDLSGSSINVTGKLQSGLIETNSNQWRMRLGVTEPLYALVNGSVSVADRPTMATSHDIENERTTISVSLPLNVPASEQVTWVVLSTDSQGSAPVMTLEWSRPWPLAAIQERILEFDVIVPWYAPEPTSEDTLYPFDAETSEYVDLGIQQAVVDDNGQRFTHTLTGTVPSSPGMIQYAALPSGYPNNSPKTIDFSSGKKAVELQIENFPEPTSYLSSTYATIELYFASLGAIMEGQGWGMTVAWVLPPESLPILQVRLNGGGGSYTVVNKDLLAVGAVYDPSESSVAFYQKTQSGGTAVLNTVSTGSDASAILLGTIAEFTYNNTSGEDVAARLETRKGFYLIDYPSGTTDISGDVL